MSGSHLVYIWYSVCLVGIWYMSGVYVVVVWQMSDGSWQMLYRRSILAIPIMQCHCVHSDGSYMYLASQAYIKMLHSPIQVFPHLNRNAWRCLGGGATILWGGQRGYQFFFSGPKGQTRLFWCKQNWPPFAHPITFWPPPPRRLTLLVKKW